MKARLLKGSCQVFRIASNSEDMINQAMELMGYTMYDYELGSDDDFADNDVQYLDIEAAPLVGIISMKIVPLYMERDDIKELIKPPKTHGYYQAFGSRETDS